jgi:peptidyl-prolyl cis-trans isomerase SurA
MKKIVLGILFFWMAPVWAITEYDVVILVNGRAISNYDITMRMNMMKTNPKLKVDKEAAIDELIEDNLKLSEAEKFGIKITQTALDKAVQDIEKENNMQPGDLYRYWQSKGVDKDAFRLKMASNLAWSSLVFSGRIAKRAVVIEDDEIDKKIADLKSGKDSPYVFELKQINFKKNSLTASEKQILNDIKSCDNISEQLKDFAEIVDLGNLKERDLSVQILDVLLMAVKNSQMISKTIPQKGGNFAMAICSSWQEKGKEQEYKREDIRKRLYNERMLEMGNEYLQEIGHKAIIEVKK